MCKIESITSLIDTFIFIAFFIQLQYNRTRKDFDGGAVRRNMEPNDSVRGPSAPWIR